VPIIHECAQGSEQWVRLRLGVPSSSMFHKIITPKTMKLSSQAAGYLNYLIAEWMTGEPVEQFENDWTRHGVEYEAENRIAYEFSTGQEVRQVGFVTTDDGMVGASPDGMVGEVGLWEGKCPKANTPVGYLINQNVDEEYRTQLQGQLWVCEREYADIQSYVPGLPTVVIRENRDDKYISLLSTAVRAFVDVMLEARAKLMQKYGPFPERKRRAQADGPGPLGVSDADVTQIIQSGVSTPQFQEEI
jgi:YqaJ-like recombinase protein